MHFSELVVSKVEPYLWRLYTPLVCQISGERFVVPVNFNTDFASVPRFLWALFPPYGKYTEIATLHDYLYYLKDRPRKEIDQIFYNGLLLSEVPSWKAKIMYWSVRAFGGIRYNKVR